MHIIDLYINPRSFVQAVRGAPRTSRSFVGILRRTLKETLPGEAQHMENVKNTLAGHVAQYHICSAKRKTRPDSVKETLRCKTVRKTLSENNNNTVRT